MPLPTAIGRQKDVLYLDAQGHVAVLGTAGSGKTNLAILRSAFLSDSITLHAGKTLLVTFNKALVTYLRSIGASELKNVTVEHYHKFARGYMANRGKLGFGQICSSPSARLKLIARAMKIICANFGHNHLSLQPPEFMSEEIRYTYQLGLKTFKQLVANPPRLLAPLQPDQETLLLIWNTRIEYEKLRAEEQKLYDWDDLAVAVCDEMDQDTSPRMYKHVVIDEGQDFSPMMIRSLVKTIPADGSMTFFGDVAQQIYGRKFTWRSAGLNIVKPFLFEENYRNSKQIAEFALAITKLPHYAGVADLVTPKAPPAAGPLPTLIKFASREAEKLFVVKQAISLAKGGSVALLLRSHEEKEEYMKQFGNVTYHHLHSEMTTWVSGNGLKIGTYHSAKGLEFDSVILPSLNAQDFPDANEIKRMGADYAAQAAGRLIYVGVTRARQGLIMTYSGDCTPLIPTNHRLVRSTSA